MFRHVPNALTASRLVLAAVFFTILSFYQHEGRGDPTMLNIAFVVYLIALITDFLDGYLARRWKVEGAFGRVVDPFVDKVLVIGSFIFFAGKNFIRPETVHDSLGGVPDPTMVGRTITGVVPAMVVIILTRELMVTSFRGSGEAAGANFGAAFSGKLKMVFQSMTILVILVYVNYVDDLDRLRLELPARVVRDLCIWLTIAVTVFSGLLYLQRALAMYRGHPPPADATKA